MLIFCYQFFFVLIIISHYFHLALDAIHLKPSFTYLYLLTVASNRNLHWSSGPNFDKFVSLTKISD